MASEQKQTVKHEASDLKPVENEKVPHSVTLEGQVYSVEASDAQEAVALASELHNKQTSEEKGE